MQAFFAPHLGRRERAHSRTSLAALAALLLSLSGCAHAGNAQVVNVASHDLGCEQVDIAALENGRYAAYGCGRGAVYAQVCDQGGCRWGRLRHGHETSIAAQAQPVQPAAPREIIQAPAPTPREVIPAPAPAPREIIPAPAPAQGAAPNTPSSGTAQPTDSPLTTGASNAPLPISQGDLSAPYEAEVPTQQVAQQTREAPPQPLVETRPYPPASNYVWISGYWWWSPRAYWTWSPGYWCPPYYGYSYVPGSWYWSSGYWWYGPGGWARPGTTVIINRNIPPRSSGVAITRSFTPHRVVRDSGPGVARVTPSGSFRPSSSPLIQQRVVRPGSYEGLSSGRVRSSNDGYKSSFGPSSYDGRSRAASPSVGRVVAPGSTVRSRDYSPRDSGGGRSYAPSGGHSSGSFRPSTFSRPSGGGGGFGGGHGGGGGRGGFSPVRVSPGGGGGRHR